VQFALVADESEAPKLVGLDSRKALYQKDTGLPLEVVSNRYRVV